MEKIDLRLPKSSYMPHRLRICYRKLFMFPRLFECGTLRHPHFDSSRLEASSIALLKMANNALETLAAFRQLETDEGDLKKQLAIIRISEPISDVVDANFSPSKRGSDVSLANLSDPTPASLEADLTHYKVR